MMSGVISLSKEFLDIKNNPLIRIIAYPNTDGIISAAILAKTFRKLNKKFIVSFLKKINRESLENRQGEILFLIDPKLNASKENVFLIKSDENYCASEISYLFSKEILKENLNLSDLAVIGMIAEQKEENMSDLSKKIISESKNLEMKRGLIIYPATRPLKRALQFSTSPYIPGVTGNEPGIVQLLQETKINGDKNLLELDNEEMSRLGSGIRIRQKDLGKNQKNVGEIYILKIFNKKEDVREIATIISSCSKQGYPDIAFSYCLGDKNAKSKAMELYTKHTQEIVSGLRVAESIEKIDNGNMIILNGKDKIKDIIVGTICSMLSTSPKFKEGTILIGMAYNQDKIKVSARIVGRDGKNLKEFLEKTVINLNNENSKSEIEVRGHKFAAGCLLDKSKENEFIEALKRNSQIEIMKI